MLQSLKSFIKNYSWWYKISDTITYQKICNTKNYVSFLDEVKFYHSILGNSNKLIFDVGANVGTKSKIFSTLSKKVILFEPDLENFKILTARLKYNSECIIVNCALSYKSGIANYYSIGNDSAYNSLSEKHISTVVTDRKIIDKQHPIIQYQVNTNTLDFFIDEYGIPDYIKIDVEGFEKEVIIGLNELIPLISFEANLPEFLSETIDIIKYLDQLSNSKYLYNYTITAKFELENPVSSKEMISRLSNLKVKSLEIYCSINN